VLTQPPEAVDVGPDVNEIQTLNVALDSVLFSLSSRPVQ